MGLEKRRNNILKEKHRARWSSLKVPSLASRRQPQGEARQGVTLHRWKQVHLELGR
ncbi:hypothetical protein LEMLEM_LOCUS6819, partial [Lemmus lemmus]